MTNTEIPEKMFHRFFELQMKLEPENLSMDGEASPAHVRSRKRSIQREWQTMERAIGRRVKENDIWDIYWQRQKRTTNT